MRAQNVFTWLVSFYDSPTAARVLGLSDLLLNTSFLINIVPDVNCHKNVTIQNCILTALLSLKIVLTFLCILYINNPVAVWRSPWSALTKDTDKLDSTLFPVTNISSWFWLLLVYGATRQATPTSLVYGSVSQSSFLPCSPLPFQLHFSASTRGPQLALHWLRFLVSRAGDRLLPRWCGIIIDRPPLSPPSSE